MLWKLKRIEILLFVGERSKRGFVVLTNKFSDLNVTSIIFEHAPLGDGAIGGCSSRVITLVKSQSKKRLDSWRERSSLI